MAADFIHNEYLRVLKMIFCADQVNHPVEQNVLIGLKSSFTADARGDLQVASQPGALLFHLLIERLDAFGHLHNRHCQRIARAVDHRRRAIRMGQLLRECRGALQRREFPFEEGRQPTGDHQPNGQ